MKNISEEHKRKISDALKKAHANGVHPGWSHVNSDPDRMSYPERCMMINLKNRNILNNYIIVVHFSVGKYFLDFALIDLKIDIEVDGGQHVRNQSAIDHDKARDAFLIEKGWRIFRISWDELQKDYDYFLDELEKFINDSNIIRKYTIEDLAKVSAKKHGNKMLYNEFRKKKSNDRAQEKIEMLLKSNIDFSSYGWVAKAAKFIKIPTQHIHKLMKENASEFYNEKCYKKRKTMRGAPVSREVS